MDQEFYMRKTVFRGISDRGKNVQFEIIIFGEYNITFKEWNDDTESAGYWYDAGDAEVYRINEVAGKKLISKIAVNGDIESAILSEFGGPDGLTRFLKYKKEFGDET